MKKKLVGGLCFLFTILITPSFTADDQEVVIRVWNSGVFGGQHYGHVSLQTERSYVSLWPSDDNRLDLDGIGCIKATAIVDRNRTYQNDIVDEENRLADSVYHIRFNNRSVRNIETEWERLSQQQLIWFALGTNITINTLQSNLNDDTLRHLRDFQNPLAFNCASIVYHLLKVGGLDLEPYADGILCPHSPIAHSSYISVLSKDFNIDNFIERTKFLGKIIYPDKLGYMLRHQIVRRIVIDHGYHLFGLTNDADVDSLWNNFLRTDEHMDNLRKKVENSNDIELFIRQRYDQSICVIT